MCFLKKYILFIIPIFIVFFCIALDGPLHAKELRGKPLNVAIFNSGNMWESATLRESMNTFLVDNGYKDKLLFPEEMSFSLSFIDDKDHTADYATIAKKLMDNEEVSLIISMGVLPTQALLQNNNNITPVISIMMPGAKHTNLIDASTNTAYAKNFLFTYRQGLWLEAFSLFYTSLPFKRLGIIYPPIEHARAFSGITDMHEIARDFGFELIEYETKTQNTSPEECQNAVNDLIEQGVDAVYLSPLVCFNFINPYSNADVLLNVLHENGVKTFAGLTGIQVMNGALMGVYDFTPAHYRELLFDPILKFLKIPPVPNTTKVQNDPIFLKGLEIHADLRVAFNLKTAQTLGITLPLELLIVADGIFGADLETLKPL